MSGAPKLNETDFVRLCLTSKSTAEVARLSGIDIRSVQRRMDRLKDKYGDLRPKGFYAQQIQRYGGHVENVNSTKTYKIAFFFDAHFWPDSYHPSSTAYNIFLNVLKEFQPDYLVNGGDSFDGYDISRHPPHGWNSGPSVQEELEANKYYLDKIEKAAPKAKKFWCWGNHDSRMDSRLSNLVPQFEGVEGFSLIDHFPNWQFCNSVVFNGILKATHKWRGGEHAAYNETIRAGISYITGHDHACYIRPYTDMRGTRYGIKAGTLCDPDGPQFFYRSNNPASWQEGFILATVMDDFFHPESVIVINKKAYWNGKIWT